MRSSVPGAVATGSRSIKLGSSLRFAILCHSPLLYRNALNDLGAGALESQNRKPDPGFACQLFTATTLRLREPVPAALSQKNSLSPCATELCLRSRAGTQPDAQCLCRWLAP